jgi:mono/diheme cytochrome c family protein
MKSGRGIVGTGLIGLVVVSLPCRAAELTPAEHGKKALQERAFNGVNWSKASYENVWRQWPGANGTKPSAYAKAFRERYGLHPAPYPNSGYPMGMRPARSFFMNGIGTDCLLCHGGSIAGQSYIGLGNSALDIQALNEDMAAADGRSRKMPFVLSNVRGTSEAGAMAVFLFQYREPDLKLRSSPLDLGMRDDLCEDVPAWWLLKKKKSMYYTGSSNARSVRSIMQFMLTPLNSPSDIQKEEATFRNIQAFILSLEPPKYPFPIDTELAHKGEPLFKTNCAKCHGTYGPDWTYPNKIVPIHEIGTDPTRYNGFSERAHRHYNASWFGRENGGWLADEYSAMWSVGYQAPPLDGIWATAPYFHNGSAPTVYHVLNSKARPTYFTRSYRTDVEAYDPVKLGWRIQVFAQGADPQLSPYERRKIYDTTHKGRGNGGHTFGDKFTEEERMAVIEYLKSL